LDLSSAVELLVSNPSLTGIFTDFDGTMSPIVDRPEDAFPVEGAAEALGSLAEHFAVVAVVSGRALDDLRKRLAPRGVVLAGSYGRERSDRSGSVPGTWSAKAARAAASRAISNLEGVRLEEKGAGIALHYRGAPERAAEVGRIGAELALELGLEVRPGRMVVELTPPGPGKGEAIRDLIVERGLRRVLVAGDDVADAEAFGIVRQMEAESVLVAVRSEESPSSLTSEADIVVDDPGSLVRILGELGKACGRTAR
jgi:trehalose 6-phosphate phosphatase